MKERGIRALQNVFPHISGFSLPPLPGVRRAIREGWEVVLAAGSCDTHYWSGPFGMRSSFPPGTEANGGDDMTNDGAAGKTPAQKKPTVRIEYCTS